MERQYFQAGIIPYKDYTTPIEIPWDRMYETIDKKQFRYDTANELSSKYFDTAYGIESQDPMAKEKFIKEREQAFGNVWNKYEGDLGKGFSDVQRFVSESSKHPFMDANRKQMQEIARMQADMAKYGEELVVTESPIKPLYDEKGGWAKTNQINYKGFQAPDYLGNTNELVGDLKANTSIYGLSNAGNNYLRYGTIEGVTEDDITKIAENKDVIAAWKKNNAGWDKDIRPGYDRWGKNIEEQNSKISEYIKGVLRQKIYRKENAGYLRNVDADNAARMREIQTNLAGLQSIATNYVDKQDAGVPATPGMEKESTTTFPFDVLNSGWFKLVAGASMPGMYGAIKKLQNGVTRGVLEQTFGNDNPFLNTTLQRLGIQEDELNFGHLADIGVDLAFTNKDMAKNLSDRINSAFVTIDNKNYSRGSTWMDRIAGDQLSKTYNILKESYDFANNPETAALAFQSMAEWYGGSPEQHANNPKSFYTWKTMLNQKNSQLRNTPFINFSDPERAKEANYDLFGSDKTQVPIKEAMYKFQDQNAKVYAMDKNAKIEDQSNLSSDELNAVFKDSKFITSTGFTFIPATDKEYPAVSYKVRTDDNKELYVESRILGSKLTMERALFNLANSNVGAPTTREGMYKLASEASGIFYDPKTKQKNIILPKYVQTPTMEYYDFRLVPDKADLSPHDLAAGKSIGIAMDINDAASKLRNITLSSIEAIKQDK